MMNKYQIIDKNAESNENDQQTPKANGYTVDYDEKRYTANTDEDQELNARKDNAASNNGR